MYCIVKACKNSSYKGQTVSFYRLPVKNLSLCKEWLKRAGLSAEEISQKTVKYLNSRRICSSHFDGSRNQNGEIIPTINLPAAWNESVDQHGSTDARTSQSSDSQASRLQETAQPNTGTSNAGQTMSAPTVAKRKLFTSSESQVTPTAPKRMKTQGIQRTPPTSSYTQITPKLQKSTKSNTEMKVSSDAQTDISIALIANTKTKQCQATVETMDKGIQTQFEQIDILKHDSKELKKYTGIEDYDMFKILHKYLTTNCSENNCDIANHNLDIEKKFSNVSSENQLLLVLYKLKRNQIDSVLSSEFRISTGRISEMFKFWIRHMYRKFKIIKIWPSKQKLLQHTPDVTKQHFPDLVAISDCVEFSSQVPKGPLAGKQMFSIYKNCHTVKVMYTTAPNGALIHCSDAYGGNASDKEIFSQSDLSTRLEPRDGLMVDKGFLIKDCIQGKEIHLYRPPFLSENKQFESSDRQSGRLIARSRIVVENFNARLSYYAFLKQKKIPVLYLPIMNEISFVCGFLANLGTLIRSSMTTDSQQNQDTGDIVSQHDTLDLQLQN